METETQISLKDFFGSVRESGISGKDFFTKALLYDETKEYLKNHPDTASRLLSSTAENEQKAVREVVEATQRGSPPKGAENLGQFKPREEQFAESRPQALSPKDVADIAELAGSTIFKRKQDAIKKLNISGKVDQFAKNLRQEQRDELLKSLSEPIDTDDPEEAKNQYLERIDKSDVDDKHELKTITEDFLQQTNFHADAATEVKKTNEVMRVVVENAAEAPKIFTESFLQKIAAAENITPVVIAGAERSARFTTFVASPKNLEGLNLGAFASNASRANALEKTVENLSFLRSWEAFSAWQKTDAGLATITKNLGTDFVSSDAFNKLLQNGNRFAVELRGGHALSGAFRGAEGLISEIFTAPPSADMLSYLEALRVSGETTMSVKQFFEARLFAANPSLFHFELDAGKAALRFGEAGAARAAAKTGAKTLFKSFSSAAAKEAGSQLLTKLLPFLSANAIEALSGPVGWVILGLTTILPLLWNGLKTLLSPLAGLFSGASAGAAGGILGSLGVQQTNQKRPMSETTLMIMIVVLAPILLLFVLAEHGASTEIAAIPTNPLAVTEPIGSATLSCANTSSIYLSQKDPQWANISYPSAPACTIENSGCGPTSDTMILNAFGVNTTVPAVWNKVRAENSSECFTSCQANIDVLKSSGLAVSQLGTSWKEAAVEAAKTLKEGCGLLLVAGMAHHDGQDIGHFIVVSGINWDTGGTKVVSFYALDPNWGQGTQDGSTFTVDNIWGVTK